MAPRDPRKTARNKMIEAMKGELRSIVDQVLEETGIENEQSLNAIIGSKTDYASRNPTDPLRFYSRKCTTLVEAKG